MSTLDAILIPVETLPSERLKELGRSLLEWLEAVQTEGIGAYVDPGPIHDLLAGELPQPFALNAVQTGENQNKPLRVLREELGPASSARIVRIGLNPLPDEMTAFAFIESLRQYLPRDTDTRVIVDDVEWWLD